MVDSKNKKYIIKVLIPYLIVFYFFWSVYTIFLEPFIEKGPYLLNLLLVNFVNCAFGRYPPWLF